MGDTTTSNDFANGNLKARVTADVHGFSLARLRGKNSVIQYKSVLGGSDANSGGPIQYKVRGFKQSEASS
jgi:hypothetical protein